MTIHEPHSPSHGWRCDTCGTCRAGYPSATAAARAEHHHTAAAHQPTRSTP